MTDFRNVWGADLSQHNRSQTLVFHIPVGKPLDEIALAAVERVCGAPVVDEIRKKSNASDCTCDNHSVTARRL